MYFYITINNQTTINMNTYGNSPSGIYGNDPQDWSLTETDYNEYYKEHCIDCDDPITEPDYVYDVVIRLDEIEEGLCDCCAKLSQQ